MKAAFALFLLCATTAGLAAATAPEPAKTIPVWPDGVQGPINDKAPERVLPDQPNAKKVVRLEGVTEPTLQVYPAPREKANGTAVIICPGGGFSKLALDLEGGEVAANLNESGITAFVLKYRTSVGGSKNPEAGPVMDAQRSVALVRKRAAEFGVDPARIGLLGISAGGQVAVIATSNHAKPTYKATDTIDAASCRPDFLALVYPWKLQDAADLTRLRTDIRVDKTMPPVFIAHAADDKGAKIEGSLLLFLQLQAAGVPTEAHLYAKGGHGFGLRPADVPCPTDWPLRLTAWLKVMQLMK
jgi:acetyl esterase/lipase